MRHPYSVMWALFKYYGTLSGSVAGICDGNSFFVTFLEFVRHFIAKIFVAFS